MWLLIDVQVTKQLYELSHSKSVLMIELKEFDDLSHWERELNIDWIYRL